MARAQDLLATCTEDTLPTLDVAVMGALELLSTVTLPEWDIPFKKPIVVGSVNALSTGRILFRDQDVVIADESSYTHYLNHNSDFDGVVIVSSSGGKHAITIAKDVHERGIPCILLTNAENPPAREYLLPDAIRTYPKNREPYTYNTSTYLSMIASRSSENVLMLHSHLETVVLPLLLRNFNTYSAFVFIVPPEFAHVRDMFRTKFDELFGPMVVGRIFTTEEIKHAKTIVVSGDELFISLGCTNEQYGLAKHRLSIPLPEHANYLSMIAIGYYIIGKIQAAQPPYFTRGIVAYAKDASTVFGHTIPVIVE